MADKTIHILWDSSHIWGIMAWRAMLSFGLRCRLVKAQEIAQGALLGKGGHEPADILLVPGGCARQKAVALGDHGKARLLDWLRRGGIYLGFCGGAGLALADNNKGYGLGLCPWRRAEYQNRLYHLLSGHVLAIDHSGQKRRLPIWWPGRFAPMAATDVEVRASYLAPEADLWLADLPLASAPGRVLADLGEAFDIEPLLDFPAGQPLVISGSHGRGAYLLSYAHLETPGSRDANFWLCRLLKEFGNFCPLEREVPEWNTIFPDGGETKNEDDAALTIIRQFLADWRGLLALGVELGLFFGRAPWLLGWRHGLPGMAFNNLLAALDTLARSELTPVARQFWNKVENDFMAAMIKFLKRAETFFWKKRLECTLAVLPEKRAAHNRANGECASLFGHPMHGGGLIQQPLETLEELVFLCQDMALAKSML